MPGNPICSSADDSDSNGPDLTTRGILVPPKCKVTFLGATRPRRRTGRLGFQMGNANKKNNITLDVGKVIAAIDHSPATENEKAGAKSLLQRTVENPLLNMILGRLLKAGAG
jgi:hypothetical protein